MELSILAIVFVGKTHTIVVSSYAFMQFRDHNDKSLEQVKESIQCL